jgi:glycerate kinase
VDSQTVYGKGPIEVARRARLAGVPAVLLAGHLGEGWERVLGEGVAAVLPLAEGPATVEHMIDDAPGLLERAAERACRLVEVGCVISSTRTGGGSLGPG